MGRSHERRHLGAHSRRVIALSSAKSTAGLLNLPSTLLMLQLGFMNAFGLLRDEFVLDSKWSVHWRFYRCARSASVSVLESPRLLTFSATLHFNLRTTWTSNFCSSTTSRHYQVTCLCFA
ncbi:hypothetical protein BDZ89DRAFT_610141 [Hymenopellis radicata]|nr:hypothetical protein BDZ89DRAFT_610141 [Hymenopellis radicata]